MQGWMTAYAFQACRGDEDDSAQRKTETQAQLNVGKVDGGLLALMSFSGYQNQKQDGRCLSC